MSSSHAYTKAGIVVPDALPIRIESIKNIPIEAPWIYNVGVGDLGPLTTTNITHVEHVGLSADVAFDLFFDSNMSQVISPGLAKFDMMIWLASFRGVTPLGYWVDGEALVTSVRPSCELP